MNKKIASLIVVILALGAISPMFSITPVVKADASYTPFIEVSGFQTLQTGSTGTLRFPSCTVAQNGDLIVSYAKGDGSDASSYLQQWIMISSDNGSTWGTPYMVKQWNFYAESLWSLITAPNGDILFMVNDNQEHLDHNGTDIWRNTNNGVEGYWSYSNNFSEFGQCYVYGWTVFANTIYAFMNDPHIFLPEARSKLVYSTDNGYTWNQYGIDIGTIGGEWCMLPLDYPTTTWRSIHRNLPSDCPTGFAHAKCYANWGENYQTTNGGSSWVATGENCPEECGWGYTYQDSADQKINKGNHMFWLDDEVIVACVETSEQDAEIWVSHDNMSNWGNNTVLGSEGGSCVKNAYTRGCALPKRDGDIGGWGFLVWSEDCNTEIRGAYVYNNADLVWEEPAGPYDEEESESEGWLHINTGVNGSSTTLATRTYNATPTAQTLFYRIEVANDTGFSDIFITYDANTTNFGNEFTYNATTWQLANTTNIETYGAEYGKHYYRFRPRYKTVSE